MNSIKAIVLIISAFLMSCGQGSGTCPDTVVDQNTYDDADDCKYQTSVAPPVAAQDVIFIRGSITTAFSITVDGKDYLDIEEYYSAALDQLQDKVNEAGYGDFRAELEAKIGIQDLTNNMAVYAQGMADRAYQGIGSVDANNNFQLVLPGDAAGDYQIRANKRISVRLEKGEEKISFCYNFSANAVSVSFDKADKPVILRDFSTSLTKYACGYKNEKPTLGIPVAPDKAAPTTADESAPVTKGINND